MLGNIEHDIDFDELEDMGWFFSLDNGKLVLAAAPSYDLFTEGENKFKNIQIRIILDTDGLCYNFMEMIYF